VKKFPIFMKNVDWLLNDSRSMLHRVLRASYLLLGASSRARVRLSKAHVSIKVSNAFMGCVMSCLKSIFPYVS